MGKSQKRKETQMATKQMKRCLLMLVSREMQIKMMRDIAMPTGQAKVKNLINQEDMGKQQLLMGA